MTKQNKKESTSATRESSTKNVIYIGKKVPHGFQKGDLWFDTSNKFAKLKKL